MQGNPFYSDGFAVIVFICFAALLVRIVGDYYKRKDRDS